MDFKTFLHSIPRPERGDFAKKCGVSVGQIHNIAYGCRQCSAEIAIAIEKATEGKVRCEDLCPSIDWAYLRGNADVSQSAA